MSNDPDYVPGLTEGLVRHLEELFPPRCLGPTENVALHHRYAGKVELVAMLRARLDHQTQTASPDHLLGGGGSLTS